MIKIEKQLDTGKHTVLVLSSPVPLINYRKLVIEGKEYEPIIAYDFRDCVAIAEEGDFVGKEINFL